MHQKSKSLKGELATILTITTLILSSFGFMAGSYIGSKTTNTSAQIAKVATGARCSVSKNNCQTTDYCSRVLNDGQISAITLPSLRSSAMDQGVCKSLTGSALLPTQNPIKNNILVDQTKFGSELNELLPKIAKIPNLSSSFSTPQSPISISTPTLSNIPSVKIEDITNESTPIPTPITGQAFITTPLLCGANFTYLYDPLVTKISLRKKGTEAIFAQYTIDENTISNNQIVKPLPAKLDFKNSFVQIKWDPALLDKKQITPPSNAQLSINKGSASALGGTQRYELTIPQAKYDEIRSNVATIVRLEYIISLGKASNYFMQEVEVDNCPPVSTTPTITPPKTLTITPSNGTPTPFKSPTPTQTVTPSNGTPTPFKSPTPTLTPPLTITVIPQLGSPTPVASITPTACYGTINLVVDVTTSTQIMQNTVRESIRESILQNNSKIKYRLFRFHKTFEAYENGKELTSTEIITRNGPLDKFIVFNPGTNITSMVEGVRKHFDTTKFIEPYFVISDGMHTTEEFENKSYVFDGYYKNTTLKPIRPNTPQGGNRRILADFYPYSPNLNTPELDTNLVSDKYGRLDANKASISLKCNNIQSCPRSYNQSMQRLISTIHDNLGFAPDRSLKYNSTKDNNWYFILNQKYPNIFPFAVSSEGSYPGPLTGDFNPEIMNILGRYTFFPVDSTKSGSWSLITKDKTQNVTVLSSLLNDLESLGCTPKAKVTTPVTPSPAVPFAYQIDVATTTDGLGFADDMCFTVAGDDNSPATKGERHSGAGSDYHCLSGKISDYLFRNNKSEVINISTKFKNTSNITKTVGFQLNKCASWSKTNPLECNNAIKIVGNSSKNGGYISLVEIDPKNELQIHWNNPSKQDFVTLTLNKDSKAISECNYGTNAPMPLCVLTKDRKIKLNSSSNTIQSGSRYTANN